MKTADKKIGLYEVRQTHRINRVGGAIKNEAAVIENLQKRKGVLNRELEKTPANIIRIENISAISEKHSELLAKKRELATYLEGLGVVKTSSKLTLWIIKTLIVIFLSGAVIYRLMGWRSMEENVPAVLDTFAFGKFKFPTIANALFLEGAGVVIISFFLVKLWGNDYRINNRRKFFFLSLISAGIAVAAVFFYTIL